MPVPSQPYATTPLPEDYLERVYAGVLGKLIGVYLGRPFEGWTHQRIMSELGTITYYVNEKLGVPLVVTDDDVSGTFAFVRALEEHPLEDLSSCAIGKTWLNNVVEKQSVFWWGGRGISTEHTAFLNLKQGIPAPDSGSIKLNGQTVAEQIGAQIFIDGWAMVSPGRPALAAQLAEAAGKVSHDGESVHAAILWAAMEAEAFVSTDVNHLLDTGLQYIPASSLIARVIADVRSWVEKDERDWLKTRQRIEDTYGYDKFLGNCHVVPNHCIMVMSLLYSGNDFSRAMEIVNTSGWDTDCNSGNVGCLMAIMLGLDGFEGSKHDWRGPIADRALISSADNGYSINNASRIAADITNMGRRLAGKAPLPSPKGGAQYHFTLPGSTQGFRLRGATSEGSVSQSVHPKHGPGLHVITTTSETEVTTIVSAPKEYLSMPSTYPLCSSPLIYPGQQIAASVRSGDELTQPIQVRLSIRAFDSTDQLVRVTSQAILLSPKDDQLHDIQWTVPQIPGGYPIAEVGIVVSGAAASKDANDGELSDCSRSVWLNTLGWTGQPNFILERPQVPRPHTFWDLAWVRSVSNWQAFGKSTIYIAQDTGEGLVSYGTREWTDYRITVNDFAVMLGSQAGVVIRVQGLRRYYALVFTRFEDEPHVALIKALDEDRIVIAKAKFDWALDVPLKVCLEARGSSIVGSVDSVTLTATDNQYEGGGMGFIIDTGALSTGSIVIQPSDPVVV